MWTHVWRRPYILLVRKFRTSEMLDKWSLTSKLFDIKLSHIPDVRYIFFTCTRTHLSAIPVFDIFKIFPVFSRPWMNFEYWITCQLCEYCEYWITCQVSDCLRFASFFERSWGLVFLYLNYFTLLEFSLTEFLRVIFHCSFLLGLRKKGTGRKARKKCSPKLNQKYSFII